MKYYIILLKNGLVVDVLSGDNKDWQEQTMELFGRQLGLGTAEGFDTAQPFETF